jgi:hypothetical protein
MLSMSIHQLSQFLISHSMLVIYISQYTFDDISSMFHRVSIISESNCNRSIPLIPTSQYTFDDMNLEFHRV